MSAFDNTVPIKTSTKVAKAKSVKTNPVNTVVLPPISPPKNAVPEVEKIFVSEHEAEDVHDFVSALESEAESPVPEGETATPRAPRIIKESATPKAPRVRKVIPIKYMKLISFTFNVLANFTCITPDEAYDILVSTFRLGEDIETIMESALAKMKDEEMLTNTKVFLKTKKAERIKAAKDAEKAQAKAAVKAEKDAEKATAKAQAKVAKDAEKVASLTNKLVEKADEVEAVVAVDQENREANPEVKKTLRKAKNAASKALENTMVPPPLTQALLNAGFTEVELMGQATTATTITAIDDVDSPKPITKRFKKAVPAPIQTENLEVVEPVVESVFVPTTLKEQDQKLDEKKSVAKNLQASRAASTKKPRKGAAAAETAAATTCAVVTDELNADAEV